MRQILWFRRDLRVEDSALLQNAKDKVLPIFIFDKNILNSLPKEDKRVNFIYKSVIKLKKELQKVGLDLAVFYAEPKEVFTTLQKLNIDEVSCSVDFDSYAKKRDKEIEKIIPMKRHLDSFILDPKEHLKKDKTPYKVFTPFYNSLDAITQAAKIELKNRNKNLRLIDFDYSNTPTLENLGFKKTTLPDFFRKRCLLFIRRFF